MQFLTASHKVIPKLKFKRTVLHNNVLACHFRGLWSGPFYVLAVDYNRYVIAKYRTLEYK